MAVGAPGGLAVFLGEVAAGFDGEAGFLRCCCCCCFGGGGGAAVFFTAVFCVFGAFFGAQWRGLRGFVVGEEFVQAAREPGMQDRAAVVFGFGARGPHEVGFVVVEGAALAFFVGLAGGLVGGGVDGGGGFLGR